MLCLQNGRFDDPDRSFTSIKAAWESVLRNHADLKVPVQYCITDKQENRAESVEEWCA